MSTRSSEKRSDIVVSSARSSELERMSKRQPGLELDSRIVRIGWAVRHDGRHFDDNLGQVRDLNNATRCELDVARRQGCMHI
jgi:hypothetical protein